MTDPLQEKFPDMTPVRKPPSLETLNGIGFAVYGRRDFDDDTETYVTTWCFCLLFVPIIALKAFRVADAPQGWYFLGRVPLSGFARAWNFFLLGLLVCSFGLGGWAYYTSRPDYQGQQALEKADRLAESGKFLEAADLYRHIVGNFPNQAPQALQKLSGLLDSAKGVPPEVLVQILPPLVDLQRSGKNVEALLERSLALAKHHSPKHPHEALKIMESVVPLAHDPREIHEVRLTILDRLVHENPQDLDALSEWAVLREARRELEVCEKILVPQAHKLGSGEGARILGQIYVTKGKKEEAILLLAPYAEERLKTYQAAEENYKNTVKQVDDETLAQLQNGKAADFNFAAYRALDMAAQDAMVRDYLDRKLREDVRIKKAQEALQKESKVVGVALDLGMLHLQHGQTRVDPGLRKQEMEKAEKMFLAVRGAAGQTGEYRLNLGQVYYWLGQHAKGQELFHEFLKAEQRSSGALRQLAISFRQVGEVSQAKAMAEEAYEKELDQKRKYSHAEFRAAMAHEPEERLHWLGRGNPDDLHTQADLSSARGQQALQAGDEVEAAERFRQAVVLLDKIPENYVSLNNAALALLDLFRATGDFEQAKMAQVRLEKALTYKQDDSILLHNLADQGLSFGLGEILRDHLDLSLLRSLGHFPHFEFLYRDKAGRDKIIQRVQDNPAIVQAQKRLERVLLLAPKRPSVYQSLNSLYLKTRNAEGLKDLKNRLQETKLDLEERNKKTLENYQGKNDDKNRKDLDRMKTRTEKILNQARQVGGPTFAVASSSWISLKLAEAVLGQTVHADPMVQLAEEMTQAAPSRGSDNYLMAALLFRAHQTICLQESAYAALAKKGHRTLGSTYLMAQVMFQGGPLHQKCLENPDVQRVIRMLMAEVKTDPELASEWTWAMLRHAAPEQATQIVQHYVKNERAQMDLEIQGQTSPLLADLAFRRYWALHMNGQEEQALAVLEKLVKAGVPIPAAAK